MFVLNLTICALMQNFQMQVKVCMDEDHEEGDNYYLYNNPFNPENYGESPRNAANQSLKRLQIAKMLKEKGTDVLTRPWLSNSRSNA